MNKRIIIAGFIWLLIFGVGAMVFRFWWKPTAERHAEEQVKEEEEQKIQLTSADSRYKFHPQIGLDSFNGYAILRSQEMKNHAAKSEIQLRFVPDQADYVDRLRRLHSGELDMAVFTIDSLIAASEEIGDTPAVIVDIIDETRGADLIVGYNKTFPNIDSLNSPNTRFVLMMNSPSETLVRVMLAQFKMDELNDDPFIPMNSQQELFNHYRSANQNDPYVYVTWQPWGTRILDNPNTHTIIASDRLRGYIVDVMVVSRDYLYKNREVVKEVVKAYKKAVYDHRDNLVELVISDAATQGQPLSQKQAEELVEGIWWKNTQESYAHFGVGEQPLQHVEDMIMNLTEVLIKTGSIKTDPTNGRANLLYYPEILKELANSQFHPGIGELVRSEKNDLPSLTDEEWSQLRASGTLQIPQLVFARGTSRLSSTSTNHLDKLIETLKTFPTYYVIVRGDASTVGNLEANKTLALQRAEAAKQYLIDHGVAPNRVKAIAGMPTGQTAVNFLLGEPPY